MNLDAQLVQIIHGNSHANRILLVKEFTRQLACAVGLSITNMIYDNKDGFVMFLTVFVIIISGVIAINIYIHREKNYMNNDELQKN